MSKMMMRSERKPPLSKSSSSSLRPRCALRSTMYTAQSQPAASLLKTPLANRSSNIQKMELPPEYQTISCEFRALSKMVQDELGKSVSAKPNSQISSYSASNQFFERGRFYDEYSARRNERLKRKRGEAEENDINENVSDITVGNKSLQKTELKRREGAKRSIISTPMIENKVGKPPMTENRVGNSRYMLRSMSKENKRPPLPVKYEGSAVKSVMRRARKI